MVFLSRFGSPKGYHASLLIYTQISILPLFGIRRQNLGDFIPSIGFSKAVLLTQLASFAYALGLMRMAWKLYKLALENYQFENKLDSLRSGMIHPYLTTLEAIFGDPLKSLGYAQQAKKSWAIEIMINRKEKDLLSCIDLSMDLLLPEISEEDNQKAEQRLLYTVFVPMLCFLMGANPPIFEIDSKLARWGEVIKENEKGLLYPKEWLAIIQFFVNLIHFWKEGQEFEHDFDVFGDRTTFEILWYIFTTDRPTTTLKEAFTNQVRAAITILQYGQLATHMLDGFGRFIHRYWSVVAQTRRFALRHPQQFYDELRSISPNLGGATVDQVLKSAGNAVGVNLSSDVREQLNQVWKISRPWDFNPDLFVNKN
jgi:hypothetical protein